MARTSLKKNLCLYLFKKNLKTMNGIVFVDLRFSYRLGKLPDSPLHKQKS
jgi:hypothetical protein